MMLRHRNCQWRRSGAGAGLRRFPGGDSEAAGTGKLRLRRRRGQLPELERGGSGRGRGDDCKYSSGPAVQILARPVTPRPGSFRPWPWPRTADSDVPDCPAARVEVGPDTRPYDRDRQRQGYQKSLPKKVQHP